MNPFKVVINSLDKNKVRYIAVGGFAAVLHGSNRFTGDIDIILDFAPSIAFLKTYFAIGLETLLPSAAEYK